MTGDFQPPRPQYPNIYQAGGFATASGGLADEQQAESERHLQDVVEAATASGKQPFDYELFSKAYWDKDIQGDGLTGKEPPEVVADYLKRYYLDYPEVQTIKEFARQLELGDFNRDS
jgi:hypothetical protein